MPSERRARLRELLFRIGVSLKGLDGVFEIAGGVALFVVSPVWILRAVALLTQGELIEDPRDLVANFLLNTAERLSLGSEHFAAAYLLAHGIAKIGLVAALLKEKRWAYPVAMIVFAGFIAYQCYRFTLTGALGLLAVSLFDLVVIGLIWLEYRAMRPCGQAGQKRPRMPKV